jgi:hypothetical protein
MRFERRYEGIHYAITLRPSSKSDELLKSLKELEIEIYRKSPEGHRRGYAWKVLFHEDGKELKIERYEDRHDWSGSYRKLLEAVTVRADWVETWKVRDAESIIRDLGVKGAVEHILYHLRIILGHPLSIPLRL